MENDAVRKAAVRVLGNGACGGEFQTDHLLGMDLLRHLKTLLEIKPNDTVIKEIAWAVSNIAAGTAAQLQEVLDTGDLLKILSANAQRSTCQAAARAECVRALANASHGSEDQINALLKQDAIRGISVGLELDDENVQTAAITAIYNILAAGDSSVDVLGYNKNCKHMEGFGVINKIASLSLSPLHSEVIGDIQELFLDDWQLYLEEITGKVGPLPPLLDAREPWQCAEGLNRPSAYTEPRAAFAA